MRLVSLLALVELALDSGAEGIHGPVSLLPESDLEEELSEPDGGGLKGTPGGRLKARGWASTRAGNRPKVGAAIRHASAVARKSLLFLWMVVFMGGILWHEAF